MHKTFLILITGKKLDNVYSYIKGMSSGYWKYMPNSIIIGSNLKAQDIRDKLTREFKKNELDRAIVFEISGTVAWSNIPTSGSNWLNENL